MGATIPRPPPTGITRVGRGCRCERCRRLGSGRAGPDIFYAELILDQNTKVSARVSDAIALALHLSIPIHAEDTVLDAAAVANTAIRAEGDDHAPEEVEEFRRFLDTASPEDFDPD